MFLRPADKIILPSAITLAGLLCGVMGVALGCRAGFWWLTASLLLDGVDGWVARRLKAESRLGSIFDRHTDMALAFALIWRTLTFDPTFATAAHTRIVGLTFAALATTLLVMFQALADYEGIRFSGRTLTFVLLGAAFGPYPMLIITH